MRHAAEFITHPNPAKEHMVLTPDGGVIECKHEAAAKRVAGELNEREREIARMRQVIIEQQLMLKLHGGAIANLT